jgi:hypothetical protein
MKDPAMVDDSPADSGAERQQNQVLHIAAGSHPFLTERGSIGVILQHHWRAETIFDLVPKGEILERREIVGPDDESFVELDKAGHSDSGARKAALLPVSQGSYRLHHVVDDSVTAFTQIGSSGNLINDLSFKADGGGAKIRAT